MKHLTIRDVPEDLAEALNDERIRRGQSLNSIVKSLLRWSLGLDAPVSDERRNGLEDLAGTWSQAEFEEFERAAAMFEQIDDDLWK